MFVRVYSADGQSLAQSFEGFLERVGSWEGMFAELDGSWVWVFHEQERRYQLDGMVYDRSGGIEYVEIKGQATEKAWASICNVLIADFQRTSPDAFAQHLRVHDIEQQCWRDACDPGLFSGQDSQD
ncbi:MAG: hypothetical protein NTV29_19685 [Planctomycetota bacterium]|jgi:hypothetical protein|nr:hypothetical protein [Planctomycetota bacterium]